MRSPRRTGTIATVRLLLIVTLIHGLVPAFGELAETAVHFAVEGHLAHSDADRGDLGDQGDEHGCGTTEHHCTCCVSQLVMAPPAGAVLLAAPGQARPLPKRAHLASLHEPAPPYRPPIAS